jgi:hypothetical protein
MPIFDNEVTFIHIPKCGGTSIEKFFETQNSKVSFLSRTSYTLVNNHTPQHCTFRELEHLGVLTDKIFTIVRPHIDRTISEYFYIKQHRPNVAMRYNSFDEFLDLFLNYDNTILFDNHNLPNSEFLVNYQGVIDKKIKIFNFYDINSIEQFLNRKGLNKIHEYKSNKDKKNFILQTSQRERILNFFKTDL